MPWIFVIHIYKSFKCEPNESNRNEEEILSRKCLNNPDAFCLICGNFTTVKNRLKITDFIKKVYHMYFGVKLRNQDKIWTPHIICCNCNSTLLKWTRGERSLAFGGPMVWWEPKDHIPTKCYFVHWKQLGLLQKINI